MNKRILSMLVLILTFLGLCTLSAGAQTEKDYAIIKNSVFEAEQGNLFSTVFSIETDNAVEAVEFHLSYDQSLAKLSSTEIFTIGKNTSIKYNGKFYVVYSELVDNAPEYYFFEVLDGCTDADKSKLTLEKYYTEARYAQVFLLEENQAANEAMIAHIRGGYGMIVYDEDIRINANANGVISTSWLPRNPHEVSGTNLFSLQFTIDDNLAATDYPNWLSVYTGKDSFVDMAGGKELDLTIDIAPLSIYAYGDVNFDTKVDTRDALLARQHYLEIKTLTGLKFKYADVNMDNVVNTRDALLIQQKAIGVTEHVGNRFNVYFHDVDGNICAVKSVASGQTILSVPAVPSPKGYINGQWSQSAEEGVEFDFDAPITRDTHLYAFYEEHISEYMQYYVDTLRMRYNSTYNRGVTLDSTLKYGGNAGNAEAEISWYYFSEDGEVNGVAKNEAGQYVLEQPGYNTDMLLRAYIVSWKDGQLESQNEIEVEVKLKGKFSTPTKSDVVRYLREITGGNVSASSITGGTIESDILLPRKITNNEIGAASSYEVRLEWFRLVNGVYEPTTEITRTTSTQEHQNFMGIITFNGVPLEGDGKVYLDDVTLAPITEMEIRNHIIECISESTPPNVTDGMELWNDDDTYGATVNWISNNAEIITVSANTIAVKPDAISGVSCPLTAQVTYSTDSGAKTFDLGYNVSVITENSLLQPGVNMDPSLYYALLDILDTKQLTTEHLKKTQFVSLDLSPYAEWFKNGAGEDCAPITSLKGITYCENLFLLNISGLNITEGLNELCTLTRLETLIARDAGIETLKYGNDSALAGMINLKLLDLSNNNIANLDEILDTNTVYTKLREVYLNDNNISDICAITTAPLLSTLELSNNQITDLNPLAKTTYLTKLSLSNNKISILNGLENLTLLEELRLQDNRIGSCQQLSNLTALERLYLGDNQITDVSYLKNLTEMTTLFLNNNTGLENVDALGGMTKLEVLQVSDCSIRDLGTLYELRSMRELYAENNKIGSFMFIKQWQDLEKLLLAGNANFDESVMLSEWLTPMNNLKTLTLSGRKLKDLSFLVYTDDKGEDTIKPLERLEIANCQLPAFVATSTDESGSIMEFTDNIAMLLTIMDTLKYCDISNNDLDMDLSQYSFYSDLPMDISNVRMLSQLRALYMDNTNLGEHAATITSAMSRLTHLSMENCGISSLACAGNSSNLQYLDLANNPIATCDFTTLSGSVWPSIQYMYLDTTAENAKFVNPGASMATMGNNKLKALSLEGYALSSTAYLPQMNSIRYLNLSKTGISDLLGTDTYEVGKASNAYAQSIFRFTDTLQTLDIATDGVFSHDNLNMLYNELANTDTAVYFYEDESLSGFNGQREFDHIIEIWSKENRTLTKSEFSLVSGNDWKADFRQFVADYLGFNVTDWSVVNAGTTGAFSRGSDGMLHLDDAKYGFDAETTFGITATIQVYDADPSSVATSDEVTIHMEPAERATITVQHRYWSVADSKNGSFNANSGSEVVTEVYNVITGKRYSFSAASRSGFQTLGAASVSVDVEGDKTIVFDYSRLQYTLGLDANGGNFNTNSGTTQTIQMSLYYGETTSLFDTVRRTHSGSRGVKADYMPKRTDYLFYSWYNGSTKISDEFQMPASHVTLKADWVDAAYTVTLPTKEIDADTDQRHTIYTNIDDTTWAKIREYGSTATIFYTIHIREINDGYQDITFAVIGDEGQHTDIFDKTLETAGSKKGSGTFTNKKTENQEASPIELTIEKIRQGVYFYLRAHGSLEDDYAVDITVDILYVPAY